MVSVLTSSTVDVGLSPGRVKPKSIEMLFVASLLAHSIKEKKQTGWSEIGIMCQEWNDMSTHRQLL